MKWMLSVTSFFLLTSCVPKPPDIPVFENLQQHLWTDSATGHMILKPDPICMKKIGEVECGHGVYIVSGREVFIGEKAPNLLDGKKKWSQLKAESIYLPAVESYAPLATYIINSCKQNSCNDQVDAFKVKLDSLNGIAGFLSAF